MNTERNSFINVNTCISRKLVVIARDYGSMGLAKKLMTFSSSCHGKENKMVKTISYKKMAMCLRPPQIMALAKDHLIRR